MLDVKFSVNLQFPSDYFYFQKASKCISNKFVMCMAFTKHPLPMPLQTRKTYFMNNFFGGSGVWILPIFMYTIDAHEHLALKQSKSI